MIGANVSMRGVCLWCVVCVLLSACTPRSSPPGTSLKQISLVGHRQMNHSSAMTIDLVVCYDKELYEHLKRMSAAEYFKSSSQLRTDNPTFLHILRWEMVPGQVLENYPCLPPKSNRVEGVLVFSDYITPGNHRVAVEPKIRVMRVVMGPENIQATEGEASPHTLPHHLKNYPASETLTFTSQSNKDLA